MERWAFRPKPYLFQTALSESCSSMRVFNEASCRNLRGRERSIQVHGQILLDRGLLPRTHFGAIGGGKGDMGCLPDSKSSRMCVGTPLAMGRVRPTSSWGTTHWSSCGQCPPPQVKICAISPRKHLIGPQLKKKAFPPLSIVKIYLLGALPMALGTELQSLTHA
jgi:hypothetical protein